ncbi:Nn.00g113100.m01.CDS01 [Neocucurbitaria sp. VM-36]
MSQRSDFTTIKLLASAQNGGNNRGVFLVKSKRSHKKYIEKRVGRSAIDSGHARREVEAMRRGRNHPTIIQLKISDLDYSRLGYGSIIMQHCELGSLDMLIARFSRRDELLDDEGFLWKVFWDISLALCFLHTGTDPSTTRRRAAAEKSVPIINGWNQILHRDLKPGNIFLTWKDTFGIDKCQYPTAVVGDFGACVTTADVRAGRADARYHRGGTPGFNLPEYPAYNDRCDMYTLGLIIHCLARMRNSPVASFTERQNNPLQSLFGNVGLIRGVKNCLQRDPKKRPAPNELPWLVWTGYQAWRKARKDDGHKLPSWCLHYDN